MVGAKLEVSTEAFFDSEGLGWLHHIKISGFHVKHSYGNAGADTVTSMRPMSKVIEAWLVQRDCESIQTMYFRAGSDQDQMKMIKGIASLVLLGNTLPADPDVRAFQRRENVAWRDTKLHTCAISHTGARSEIIHFLDDVAKIRWVCVRNVTKQLLIFPAGFRLMLHHARNQMRGACTSHLGSNS
jgi:hypothetical protein